MKHVLLAAVTVISLGGCVSEAEINAQLSRHIGQNEADLIREMGVPNRHYTAQGHTFLAYIKAYQEVEGFGASPGFYPYGGWGGWGWGGWGGWGGGWGGPATVVPIACETDFDVVGGRVTGFARHGNDC
jgi:hypothetical protein